MILDLDLQEEDLQDAHLLGEDLGTEGLETEMTETGDGHRHAAGQVREEGLRLPDTVDTPHLADIDHRHPDVGEMKAGIGEKPHLQ